MIQDPPATGSAELNSFLVDVKNAINTATKPLAGWKLSDFEAGVSEVISDKRDLIDIVTAWDDLVNIRNNFETEVARYETLYSDSKVLGDQYQEYADTFSQIMEWWDQNVRLIEDIEAFLTEVNADMSAAASSASAAATSEANAKTSETNAGNSASSASSSASSAADSASDAADSASTAASSASAAADSASDAAGAADSAAGSKSQAASSASAAASSASAADSAATRAEAVADSTHWQDDRLSVMGQLGPSLKGPPGDKGEPGDGSGDVLWSEIDPVLSSKADLVGGQVPTSQIPAVALTKPSQVNTQSEMLALVAEEGDVAVITSGDWKGTYMLGSGAADVAASWVRLSGPDAPVQSVNGQSGTVVLGAGDVGAAPVSHTHTAEQISDATATGKSVVTATSAAAARTAIGAGTSSLALGTTSSTAKAGNYQPTAAEITDATTVGRGVLTAADAAAARGAIGAGTSDLTIGTASSTAKAGDWKPAAADITDATAIGQSVVKATTTAAARTAIGAGTSNLAIGTTASTAKAGNYTPTVAGVTGLQSALDGKANASHTHTISQITDMLPISTSTTHENSIPYRTTGGAIAVPTASITTSGSVTNKAYVDARTPEIRVVTTMPTSPTPGVVYLKFG